MMKRLFVLLMVIVVGGWLFFEWKPTASTPQLQNFAPPVPVTVQERPLTLPQVCGKGFVAHNLDFASGTRLREINTYESNGAGVAVNDLNGDGQLDLVFASVDGNSVILWNKGDFKFETQELADPYTRAVAIIDVDSDGQPDIVFTHRSLETLSYWHNQGPNAQPRFVKTTLPGVNTYAYSMAWGDLNNDGVLDLVTGSYNIDLQQHKVTADEMEDRGGIVYYIRQGEQFVPQPLAQDAQALSIGLVDLDGDGNLDVWVANDFALQDQVWLHKPNNPQVRQPEWQPAQPFAQTSHSTMSIDWADLGNDGGLALFTTDMNPYDISTENMARWLPMMNAMEKGAKHVEGDPQIMANVLQVRERNGSWQNEAGRRGVDATGWSWASKFGDLDNDGFLDLYVVNGMIAQNLFGYLDNGELIEENQAFRNPGDGMFVPAPSWNLGSTRSGRGMVMADLNNDGRLDIIVNNLRNSAQLFENQLCGGSSLEVALQWPASHNLAAIGSQLELHTSRGVYRRDVRASGGYLSGDPMRVHFGFPQDATLQSLHVQWPDGTASTIEQLTPQTQIIATRAQ